MALKALKWKRLKQSVLVQRKASSPMVADGDRVVPSYIHQRRLVEPPGAAQSAAHLKGWQHSLDLVAKRSPDWPSGGSPPEDQWSAPAPGQWPAPLVDQGTSHDEGWMAAPVEPRADTLDYSGPVHSWMVDMDDISSDLQHVWAPPVPNARLASPRGVVGCVDASARSPAVAWTRLGESGAPPPSSYSDDTGSAAARNLVIEGAKLKLHRAVRAVRVAGAFKRKGVDSALQWKFAQSLENEEEDEGSNSDDDSPGRDCTAQTEPEGVSQAKQDTPPAFRTAPRTMTCKLNALVHAPRLFSVGGRARAAVSKKKKRSDYPTN